MAVRAVVFDAVGTLIHPEPGAADVYLHFSRQFGSRLDLDTIRERFGVAFTRQEEIDRARDWRTSEDRERERWRTIVADVLTDLPDTENCFGALYDYFAQPRAWRVDREAAAAIAALRKSGLAIAMASNYDQRLRRVLTGMKGLADIEQVFISSEIGWRKPSRRFFAAVCERLGFSLGEVVYVGDELKNDYLGAVGAGLRALLYDPKAKYPHIERRIERLNDWKAITET